ncbi:hypothetical protein CAAN1_16S03048 [[Candida] anglica]|uniref:Uncharacterized protein n=1 Tax=[Candida] anglica TaxID=148631 RepID=A0ABP0EA65_9ASCO
MYGDPQDQSIAINQKMKPKYSFDQKPMGKEGSRLSSKQELLARFQDNDIDEDILQDDVEANDSVTMKLNHPRNTKKSNDFNDEFYGVEDNFKTITVNGDDLATLRASLQPPKMKSFENETPVSESKLNNQSVQFNLKNTTTPTLRPKLELNEREESFFDGFEDLSPGTLSTSSPKTRRSKTLSEYSEDNNLTSDTDVTSEFNDADNQDIDNIFGVEESGVYSSGGFGPKPSKANTLLELKKKELELNAEREEEELLKRTKEFGNMKIHEDEKINTLRLKDFTAAKSGKLNPLDMDALENERTINYEYTRDDFEDFEDGFELNSPIRIPKGATHAEGRINSKLSMPQFEATQPKSSMKKYRSMIDVNTPREESEHPFFNNKNNDIIRKLNRIPSFYSSSQLRKPDRNEDLDSIEELKVNDETYSAKSDLEMERKKVILLEKYMEITNTQLKNKRKTRKHVPTKTGPTKLGLVRCLNEGGESSIPSHLLQNNNKNMKYNSVKQQWEGNYIDLHKFESIKSLKTTKPHLISHKDYRKDGSEQQAGTKIVGSMKYDPDAMKWINVNEDEEDIFDDVPDLPHDLGHQRRMNLPNSRSASKSNLKLSSMIKRQPSKLNHRGVSTTSAFTQRTTSTSTESSSDTLDEGETQYSHDHFPEFTLDDKTIDRFYKEEAKWFKKTRHWFGDGEGYDLRTDHRQYNKDYFWEIRNMVTDDEN